MEGGRNQNATLAAHTSVGALALGIEAAQEGDAVRALVLFETAISQAPRQPAAYLHAARLLRSLGRLEEAGAAFRRVLAFAPQNVPALVGVAAIADERNETDRAIALLTRAFALVMANNPEDPKSLFKRLRRLVLATYVDAASRGRGFELYRLGFRATSALCATPLARSAFRDRMAGIDNFFAAMKLSPERRGSLAHETITGYLWEALWGQSIEPLADSDFDRVVRVAGGAATFLKRTVPVLVVHRHCVFAKAFWHWLRLQGQEAGPTIGVARWKYAQDPDHNIQESALETAKELKAALDSLRRGGLAQILPDGLRGKRPVALPWLGRLRDFQPGFAELAVRSGAQVVPVDAWMSNDGSINIDIDSPLEIPASGDRTSALISQYANWLERRWMEHPSSVVYGEMAIYLRAPEQVPEQAPA